MRAVILAGGNGTRLVKYSSKNTGVPKHMLSVGDKPLIEIIVRQLVSHGFRDITIITGFMGEKIEKHISDLDFSGVSIKFVRTKEDYEDAGSLLLVPDLKQSFLVMHGDILTDLDFSKLVEFHKDNKADISLPVKRLCDLDTIGFIDTEGNLVREWREVPSDNYLNSMSICVCEPEILEFLGRNYRLDDLVNTVIKKNKKVLAYKNNNYFEDIGTDSGYEKARLDFEKNPENFL
jgi:NDP-sugar pyrophosphorylase family protein